MVLESVWPLGNSATPDEMNTSFGPRIDQDSWDFHDGIDLPAPCGTPVHAMRGGTVRHAGPGGTGGYSSRHVVIETDWLADAPIYNVYLHLASIDPGVVTHATVQRGQVIGTVGDDDATYCHLHLEFRNGTPKQIGSAHPLSFLPYTDTVNFKAAVADRFNRLDSFMAARLRFCATSRLEGDLRRVEVELRRGPRLLTTRVVDFDDKNTIVDGKGDAQIYTGDIGVEGYQKSNMALDDRTDLAYGILVRKIPSRCDTLIARVIDVGGNTVTSGAIVVPNQSAVDEFLDFEDGQMLPSGWTKVTSASGSGTTVSVEGLAAHAGLMGLRCRDESTTEGSSQRAAIEYTVPLDRFEWRAEAWLNPTELELAPGGDVYLLYFLTGNGLSVAARVRNDAGTLRAGLVAKRPDGSRKTRDSAGVVELGIWRRWRLELLRVGTREATAILYLDQAGRMREQVRLNWDSSEHEPQRLRVGIGRSSMGTATTVLVDEVWLTECELSA